MPRWLKLVLGTAFLIVGLLGLVLPVLQGLLFLAAGLLLLSEVFPQLRVLLHKLEARYPAAHTVIHPFRARDGSLRLGKLLLVVAGLTVICSAIAFLWIRWSSQPAL